MKTYIEYMRTRLPFVLLALLGLTPTLMTSCSNPSAAPDASATTYNYSAAAFFNTTALGDTAAQPFQCGFPADFLKDKLGLTDEQVVAIQGLQDSIRLAMKTQLDAMKAAGTVDRDAVRALRQQFQAQLEAGLANILTADQLAQLKALAPPQRPREDFRRGGRDGRGDCGPRPEDSLQRLTPEARDSVMLARLTADLTAKGLPLTPDQITLIQDLQSTLRADMVSTPEQKHAQFDAQMQTILTAQQLAVLPKPKIGEGPKFGDGDGQRHGHRH